MNKKRFALIVCFLLCLFSCCGRQSDIELPSALASQGSFNYINIYIDKEFNINETTAIQQALETWESASNQYIRFNYVFNQSKPGKLEDYFWTKQFHHSVFIWKVRSKDMSIDFDVKYINFVGFWDLHGNIILFTDRMEEKGNQFYDVTVHEVGHMLGLKHIDYEPSVMQPKAVDISSCITKDDADRLCLIYGCHPHTECN